FGHGDIKVIKRIAEKSLVDGLVITNNTVSGLCEDCVYGKITRRPFDDVVVPETEPLERVSLDLWGRASVRSRGGAWYMLLCAD
ncbi:MAG: hypothetical protein NXY57DRAFT_882401, partial [Lentinula lateritia]